MVFTHMTGENSTRSPLKAAAGAAGPHVTDAFKLLSDETRLAILLALWEAYDPRAEDNSVSFSELYDRVSVRDSGNFTYHLDNLVGHFVEETADGYQLRNSGLTIVRAIIAGAGFEERQLPPTEIPRSCHWCNAPVELSYEDERLYQICTECEGNIGPESTEQAPVGTLVVYDNFNPAGLTHRTPGEVFVAGTIEYHRAVTLLIRGVCPECSGAVEEFLHICEAHEALPGELCSTCDTWNEVRINYVCSVCKYSGSYPVQAAVYDHPAVVAFYYEHGFKMTYGLDDPDACAQLWDRLGKDHTLLSEDPIRIRVTVSCDGEELYLILDGDLDVIDVTKEDRETDRDSSEDVRTSVPSGESTGVRSMDSRESTDEVVLPDKEKCLQQLRRHRWSDEVTCPHCGQADTIKKGTTTKDAQRYQCHNCERTFNDLTGTIFAEHHLTLPEMFYIIRKMDETKTAQIARQLDRSYGSILDFVHEVQDTREKKSGLISLAT